MFGRGFGGLGKFLLIALTLVVSFTNTWLFMNEFLPESPFWLRPAAFVFFEGGFVFWARHFKHDSENVPRTIIAGLMALACLLAVLTATCYEAAKDMQALGFQLNGTIKAWIPLSILMVMLGQIIALALHYFADDRFFERLRHINRTGRTPQISYREVTGQLVSVEQTGEIPAIAKQRDPIQIAGPEQSTSTPTANQTGWFARKRQALGKALLGDRTPESYTVSQPDPEEVNRRFQQMKEEVRAEILAERAAKGESDPLAQPRSEE